MVTPTTAPRATMSQMSPGLTVRMLPKRTAKRSALKPRARLMRTTARAKPPERKTARAASPDSAPARAQALDPDRAGHRHHERADDRRDTGEQPQRHAGQRHVGEGVGDERQAARHQEHADGRDR